MFKDMLKKLRKSKKMTQDDLASRLFVSRTLVTKWETGVRYPSRENLQDLATLFEVSFDSLVKADREAFSVQQELEETGNSVRNDTVYSEGSDADEDEIVQMANRISCFLRTLTKEERDLFMRRYYYMEPLKKISGTGKNTEETEKILTELRVKMFDYLGKESLK